VHDRESPILCSKLLSYRDRFRIPIKSEQPSLLAQVRENRSAMPPAPEGRIDVTAMRLHRERRDRLRNHHGIVAARHSTNP
jgi:hypothetical protein